ncbi:MFS transporter [Streptomyces sp. SID9944]|nr:MFS transporter [Streptomyces sp. SID9944]
MSSLSKASSGPVPVDSSGESGVSHRTATLVLACAGVFISYLPVVGVSTSIGVIQQALDASTAQLQWILDAFVLPTAALLLSFGVIGDRFGRKKVFLTGLLLTVAGCLIALTASGAVQVCVGQAVTGAGSAALLPSTLGLVAHVHPDRARRARAIAVWTAFLGLGLTLGPLVNGLILNHAAWRWIFLPSAILGAVVAVAGFFLLRDSRSEHLRHLDVPGQILAIVGITGVVYGVIEGGGTAGWGDAEVVVAFVLAGLGLVGFVLAELRSSSPMLDLRLFRSSAFSGAALVMTITLFAQVGLVFALSEYFSLVHHASAWNIGVRLIAVNGLTVVLAPVVGRLMNRFTPSLVMLAGLVVSGVGALLVTLVEADTGTGETVLLIAVMGVGLALAVAPITTVAMNSLPRHLAPVAGSSNSALRQIGSALAPAVFGVVLTHRTLSSLAGHLSASGLSQADQGQVDGMVHGAGIQAGAFLRLSGEQSTEQALGAFAASFTDALHECAWIGGIGMLIAAMISLLTIGVKRTQESRRPTEATASTGAATPLSGRAG